MKKEHVLSAKGLYYCSIMCTFFIFCTFSPLKKIINDGSHEIPSQILSFHTFPRSELFGKKSGRLLRGSPNSDELDRVATPNLGSFFCPSPPSVQHLQFGELIIFSPITPRLSHHLTNFQYCRSEEVKWRCP